MELLDAEWLAELARCPLEWGDELGSMVVRVDVSGAPSGGTLTWYVEFENGRLASCGEGRGEGAALTLSTTWADAERLASGQLGANAAFMTGRIKTDGPTRPLLAILRVLESEASAECRARLPS